MAGGGDSVTSLISERHASPRAHSARRQWPRRVIAGGTATLLGVALIFAPIDPLKALYWSAVVNGVVSIPIMAVMMLMAARRDIMGALTVSTRLKVLGWSCTGVMTVAVVAMVTVS